MNKLEKIYNSILNFADCTVNQAGYIQTKVGKETVNIIIDGKDLVFPTTEQLRNPQPNTVVFHPLMENELGGESPIVARLRELIFLKFNKVTAALIHDLISIVNSTELHKHLTGASKDILYQQIPINQGSSKAFSAICKSEAANFGKLFVGGWLRKGGTINSRTYSRAGIVNFYLYNKLKDDSYIAELPKGVRKDDPNCFRKLLKFIYPNIETPSSYCEGSDSRVAPFFDALMKTAKTIANDLQTVLDNYREHLTDAAEYSFDSEWVEDMANLESLRGQIALIPSMPVATTEPAAAPVVATPVDIAKALSATQQVPTVQAMPNIPPASSPDGKRRSITELAASNPHFGVNVMMENNKANQFASNNAIQALMSGNVNQNNIALVAQALQAQNQVRDRLVAQLGPNRANQALALMQQGMSERDAAMHVLANTPKEPDVNQLLAALANNQNMQPNNAALLAALANNQAGNIPQGYPNGNIVNIGGKNYLQFTSNVGGQQLIPIG